MQALSARTVIKYPGAKWRLADWIIERMPEHKSYVEPYFGSGAVFFKKAPSRIETINDIDSDVVNLFIVIRDRAAELAGKVYATPFSREEYLAAYERDNTDSIEKARTFLLKCWQGHGFRICYRSGWKNDIAGREYAYAVRYWNQLPEWIMQTCERLKQAQIEHLPAIDVIKRFNRPEVLIYADPPYVLSTRQNKKMYSHEMKDSDHVELIETLNQHKGTVLLSGYDNPLYTTLLKCWTKHQTKTTAEKGLTRIETLWVKEAQ